MNHTPPTLSSDRPFRIPPVVWLIAVGLVAALVAIFVFKVALDTVFFFGLLGLMLFSHLFMHGGPSSPGGHGSHSGHSQHSSIPAGSDNATDETQSRGRYTGGCH
ncbi:MAG: hypothetical protein Fur0022_01200 [Anaerolineales bacterium]